MLAKPKTISEYIKTAPKESQKHLRELRTILKKIAPKAKETLKWGNPVFEEERILFAYSAFKSHINFMPTHRSLEHFRKELKKFKTGKDTIQLPHDRPLPFSLIRKIANHRAKDVRENNARWM